VIDEYENEKIRGLPEDLPTGETLLWQGSPDWRSLARHMVHANKVAIYFAALAVWSAVSAINEGGGASDALAGIGRVAVLGGIGLGLLCVIAWLTARTTVYSITSDRLVMRIGVVVPMTMNLPFRSIGTAGVKHHRDGTGDIALEISSGDRIAFLHLWPHVRPWRINNPEPALRSLPDVQKVTSLLATALSVYAANHPDVQPAASKLLLFPVGRPANAKAPVQAPDTLQSEGPETHRSGGQMSRGMVRA
jgi:Bacterial PH domain